MKHYVREQPGEIWHVINPAFGEILGTFCGKKTGSNSREKHQDTRPKERICGTCEWMAGMADA